MLNLEPRRSSIRRRHGFKFEYPQAVKFVDERVGSFLFRNLLPEPFPIRRVFPAESVEGGGKIRRFPAREAAAEFAGELPHFKPESGIGGHRLKKSRRRFFRRGITDFAQDIGKLKGRNQLRPDFIRQLKREISLVPLRERDENTFSFIRDFDTAVVEVQRPPFRRGGQGQRQPAERDVRGAGHLGILPAVRREHGADCRFVVTFPGGAEIAEILPGRPAHATPVVPEGACPDGDVDRVAFAPDREAEFAIAGGRTHVDMGKWKGVGDFHIQTPTPFFRRIFPNFAISPVTTTAKACRARS